jgi:putative Ca2+/H+ antiporter (TMEM165/GDT1 family)
MLKRLTQLSFVIGLFFTMVSVVLFGNILLTNSPTPLNLYTAIAFLVFGVYMMLIERKKVDSAE